MYSSVLEHLHRLKRDAQSDAQAIVISEYITQLQVRREPSRPIQVATTLRAHRHIFTPSQFGHVDCRCPLPMPTASVRASMLCFDCSAGALPPDPPAYNWFKFQFMENTAFRLVILMDSCFRFISLILHL